MAHARCLSSGCSTCAYVCGPTLGGSRRLLGLRGIPLLLLLSYFVLACFAPSVQGVGASSLEDDSAGSSSFVSALSELDDRIKQVSREFEQIQAGGNGQNDDNGKGGADDVAKQDELDDGEDAELVKHRERAKYVASTFDDHTRSVKETLSLATNSLQKADKWKSRTLTNLKENPEPMRASRVAITNLKDIQEMAPGYYGEQGGKGSAKPSGVAPRPKVDWYIGCPVSRPKLKPLGKSEREHSTKILGSSPTLASPFRYATYFCDILPEPLYEDINKYWPPDNVMDNFAQKSKTCKSTGCRFYVSALEKLGGKEPKALSNWESWPKAKDAWTRLRNVVFSPEFERALFAKLQVRKPVRRREIRVFTDRSGWSNGRVHSDRDAKKVATMQLYFPETKDIQYDYGTCLHTTSQYKSGKPIAGNAKEKESACNAKFKFIRNSGYSFRPGTNSWHSAPNGNIRHWKEYNRYTILINWY